MEQFKIPYPLKPMLVNQIFGVNGAYYQANKINIKGHNGIDFASVHGQPVYACHDGYAFYEIDENQGDGFVIITNKAFLYEGKQVFFKTIYWHLCSKFDPIFAPLISTKGNAVPVKAGQLIGFADSTGFSTGDHLHFGLKPVQAGEPLGATTNTEPNNGYLGAIDPAPFFNTQYAQDLPDAHITFPDTPIEYGDTSQSVALLQWKLKGLGLFDRIPTGYYGDITAMAVLTFQKKFNVAPANELDGLKGRSVGPKTRAMLNSLH